MGYKRFKDGQESVESDPQFGRSATSRRAENAEFVWVALNKDRGMTMRELEADMAISKTSIPLHNLYYSFHKLAELCEIPRCLL